MNVPEQARLYAARSSELTKPRTLGTHNLHGHDAHKGTSMKSTRQYAQQICNNVTDIYNIYTIALYAAAASWTTTSIIDLNEGVSTLNGTLMHRRYIPHVDRIASLHICQRQRSYGMHSGLQRYERKTDGLARIGP